MDYTNRLGELRAALEKHRLDALVVTHLPNIRFLCGFSGSAGLLVVSPTQNIFFTDGRYTEQAQKEIQTARIRILKGKSALFAASAWLGKQRSYRRIGIEAAHLTVADRDFLSKGLRQGTRLVSAAPLVERLRMVKDSAEIVKISAACRLATGLWSRLLQVVRAGVPESRIAGELEFSARKAGAEQMAFPTIVASGPRSALPHGRASSAPLPGKGFVVCDFGVILAGYCSDTTRTLHVGRPSPAERSAYEAVQDAQQAAVDAVKPGTTAGEIDFAARNLLKKRNLARYFTHSTGHGVGLEIHEAPRIAIGQTESLRPGMVITIEPGIYLPGKWGVRIEDTVVVTDTGCEILTPCPKDLALL